jgi:hypothetical protein
MKIYNVVAVLMILAVSIIISGASGCSTDASVASRNLSTKADMFEIDRRIVFYNGITDTYLLTIEGRCSIEPSSAKLMVTCKTGENEYKKHYLGLSDNVTYFAEQMDDVNVSVYRYKVIFKPLSIIPDIDIHK